MKSSYIVLSICFASFFAAPSTAEENDIDSTIEISTPAMPTTGVNAAQARAEAQQKFAGLNFGVGVSATFDLGDNDRVSAAEVVGGVVRVTDQDNVRARIMLESHYFFLPDSPFLFDSVKPRDWGVGPFIALQPGSEDIIDSIGFGLMLGFRRGEDGDGFNIGAGLAFDPNTQTLGEGIVDGQPLPEGETAVRFLEQDQVGLLIITSFAF